MRDGTRLLSWPKQNISSQHLLLVIAVAGEGGGGPVIFNNHLNLGNIEIFFETFPSPPHQYIEAILGVFIVYCLQTKRLPEKVLSGKYCLSSSIYYRAAAILPPISSCNKCEKQRLVGVTLSQAQASLLNVMVHQGEV